MLLRKKKIKIFVIGRNKTGTTSTGQALASIGFQLGKQSKAELLLEDWGKRNFSNIINHCKTADAFQDIPFSLDYTYQVLDHVFPNSKFLLTIRNNSQEWYDSLIRFHTKIIGKNRIPTADDLKQFRYRHRWKGWLWRANQLIYGIDENTLYDKDIYINHYESHNQKVMEYFKHRFEDLLILNPSDTKAMQSLCEFLEVPATNDIMPHLNKSRDNS
jgi:hypothetical protein